MADQVDSTTNIQQQSAANKLEKRARKVLEKQGLVLVPGIARLTIKRTNTKLNDKSNILFINRPEVYKSLTSNTYVVFGKAEQLMNDDFFNLQQQMQAAAAAAAEQQAAPSVEDVQKMTESLSVSSQSKDTSEKEPEEDSTGLNQEDISLVMKQASVSKNKAIKALRENNNDVVEAIMTLMM
ncbi:Nascent polypeptide-associated complex subunit alpha [Zancudomyces culisetae]|uniref:Nascent polypeptide-associated complex subunit alpha n=1 Tax=Zancudomyces culisetae TaxID=1213189 RepID=A0A1R1PEZ7_ZANCU|nr:Nascent polypeptide-associated complex subunit alpha [Zancudomyces culisetae]OMH83108.1 Nascent polypeptide-associated complex subunit alpha [Zancudomyces culisetae]|eukprot:OMH79452.1 Nascent polypeptide-associated complex subunit alpha [Zancudomyces culisetae]